MFKHLIKKVREESSNASILPENSPEESNGHVTREQNDSAEHDPAPVVRKHRRSNSNTSSVVINKSRPSSVLVEEEKDEPAKLLSDMFSSYVDEPITSDNYIQILKTWVDSKEKHCQEKDDAVERLTQETSDLQNEIVSLRRQLTDSQISGENTTATPYLQKQIDLLRSDNDHLKLTVKSLRSELNSAEAERDDLLIKSTDVSNIKAMDDLQRQVERQKVENQQQHNELLHLRQALLERDTIIEQQDKRLLVDHETQATQTDEDRSFVEVLAEPDVDTISKLQEELDDKNRTIKILQQRYNDLRKTLQREFHASIPKDLNQLASTKSSSNNPSSPTTLPLIHYDSSVTSQSDVDAAKRTSTARQMAAVRKNVTFTPTAAATSPAVLPHTSVESSSTRNQKNGHLSPNDGPTALNATNFKYLKHVLLKFMTSTEDEAIHLIRAVSTLLNFSSDEERLLRETLDYKMSWFGKVARVKPLSSNPNS